MLFRGVFSCSEHRDYPVKKTTNSILQSCNGSIRGMQVCLQSIPGDTHNRHDNFLLLLTALRVKDLSNTQNARHIHHNQKMLLRNNKYTSIHNVFLRHSVPNRDQGRQRRFPACRRSCRSWLRQRCRWGQSLASYDSRSRQPCGFRCFHNGSRCGLPCPLRHRSEPWSASNPASSDMTGRQELLCVHCTHICRKF